MFFLLRDGLQVLALEEELIDYKTSMITD